MKSVQTYELLKDTVENVKGHLFCKETNDSNRYATPFGNATYDTKLVENSPLWFKKVFPFTTEDYVYVDDGDVKIFFVEKNAVCRLSASQICGEGKYFAKKENCENYLKYLQSQK